MIASTPNGRETFTSKHVDDGGGMESYAFFLGGSDIMLFIFQL